MSHQGAEPSNLPSRVSLSRLWSEWRSALVIVNPETVVAWHRSFTRWLPQRDNPVPAKKSISVARMRPIGKDS